MKKIYLLLATVGILLLAGCANQTAPLLSEAEVKTEDGTKISAETETFAEVENREKAVTENTAVGEIIKAPAFGTFGRLLFPVDRAVAEDMTLAEVSTNSVYVLCYSNIQADKTVEIVNALKNQVESGTQIFYNIYSEEEKKANPSKRDTGLFFFAGEPNAPFAVMNAGGGFMYDSFAIENQNPCCIFRKNCHQTRNSIISKNPVKSSIYSPYWVFV